MKIMLKDAERPENRMRAADAFAGAIFFLNECHQLFFCWFFSPSLFRPCLEPVSIPDGHRVAVEAHSARSVSRSRRSCSSLSAAR